jgi:alpha-glucosidase
VLSAGGLSAEITLEPFGIAWRRDGEESPSCATGRPRPISSRPHRRVAHFMARDYHERHYGLGDKAGPLDRTGRRFAIDAVDPCGFDAELSDPLYKMLPFFIVDGPQGAHGVFYDNLATGSSTSAARSTIITACSAPGAATMAISTITSWLARPCRL